MSVQPGELTSYSERVMAASPINRVMRHEGTQDFGQKNKDERKGRQHPHSDILESEEPHDVVDVSGEYAHADAHSSSPAAPSAPRPPAASVASRVANRPGDTAASVSHAPEPPMDRHIDIQV